jgi:hypothetical protein
MSSIPSSTTAGVFQLCKIRDDGSQKSGSDCMHLTIHCVVNMNMQDCFLQFVKYLAGYIYYRKCGTAFSCIALYTAYTAILWRRISPQSISSLPCFFRFPLTFTRYWRTYFCGVDVKCTHQYPCCVSDSTCRHRSRKYI